MIRGGKNRAAPSFNPSAAEAVAPSEITAA
jgi:hypothetical protein